MQPQFQPYIEAAAAIAPVTVPFLGVVLAVFLALRRFQKEQIWLRRLDAYTQILNALHMSLLLVALCAISPCRKGGYIKCLNEE